MEHETVNMIDVPASGIAGEVPEKATGVKGELESSEVGFNEKELDKFSCAIDVKFENEKWKEDQEEMICRICHLSSDQAEFPTDLIQLGCGCKGELGAVHVHCGEAWFKIKGSRTCEICGETAKNITGVVEHDQFIEGRSESSTVDTVHETPTAAGCLRGHPFCYFLMACLVIAFVLPWFFRINMV